MPETKNFEGYLGLILGSAAGALLQYGWSKEQIRDSLELCFRAYDSVHEGAGDDRMTEAAKLIGDVAQDLL